MNRKEITGTFDAALVMAPSIIVKRTELAGLWVDSALAMPPSIRKGEISGTLGDSALAMTSVFFKDSEILEFFRPLRGRKFLKNILEFFAASRRNS